MKAVERCPQVGKFHCRIDRPDVSQHDSTAPGTPLKVLVEGCTRDTNSLLKLRPEGLRVRLTDPLDDGGRLDAPYRNFRIDPNASASRYMNSTTAQLNGFPPAKNRSRVGRCDRDEDVVTIGHLADLLL
jgi:hypothetical protein